MCKKQMDYGGFPYAFHVEQSTAQNQNFRTAIWTGEYMQMTLMSIPCCEEIGMEMHEDTDQFIRVEQGRAMAVMGDSQCRMEFQENLNRGDAVFVPAGTWHNIINTGRCPLKLSSIYAPKKHPRGTIHRTKEEAEEY